MKFSLTYSLEQKRFLTLHNIMIFFIKYWQHLIVLYSNRFILYVNCNIQDFTYCTPVGIGNL